MRRRALADSVHRLWAQAWLAELASATQPDSAAMIAIGKRYGVVTQGTSLLVLDRIEDYVRYRVCLLYTSDAADE